MEGEFKHLSLVNEEEFQGSLLGWGSGEFAQHGQGTKKEDVDVTFAKHKDHPELWNHLIEISCGASHSAVITGEPGEVYFS